MPQSRAAIPSEAPRREETLAGGKRSTCVCSAGVQKSQGGQCPPGTGRGGSFPLALEVRTGLAVLNRGQRRGLDGWRRTGGSRASILKGWVPQHLQGGAEHPLEPCPSGPGSSGVSAAAPRSSRYRFLPRRAPRAASVLQSGASAFPPAPITGRLQHPGSAEGCLIKRHFSFTSIYYFFFFLAFSFLTFKMSPFSTLLVIRSAVSGFGLET